MSDSLETLSPSAAASHPVRIAALGDIHFGRTSAGTLQALLSAAGSVCDVLVLAGDLTDRGSLEDARGLAKELATVRVPIVAVLGNHDYEAGCPQDVMAVLRDAGVHVLDGDTCEIHGVGFAGVKGFCGGFGARALSAWGEPAIKQFVHEAVSEALKLETALARLTTESRVAVLHYSPIVETVVGEPPEIFAYLGSSRLEEPLTRFEVHTVFHGHAHHGKPEGKTASGIPVYNVSWMVMQRVRADRPFRLIEVPGSVSAAAPASLH